MSTGWASLSVALLIVSFSCAPAAAQNTTTDFADFGPVLAPPQLPVAARAVDLPPLPEGQGDVVLHAAGALVLTTPPEWHVTEVPWVREERLVITPEPFTGARRMPHDGAWLTYHYRPAGQAEPELAEIVGPRLHLATASRAQPQGPPVPEQIAGWPACRQAFWMEAQAADDSGTAGESLVGQHILVRTSWGIVEIHLCYPELQAESRERLLRPMVTQLKLAAPQPPAGPIDPQLAAAAEAMGAWKAYAARMEFHRDGRVVMYFDNRTLRPLDAQPAARVHITGRFTAEDDLIHVTWDDGSQQNFRWQRADLDLVLTDHTGQVSALRKLFQ